MLTGFTFLIGFLTLLGLALFRHPIWGLYAYLITFYVHPPSRWWVQYLPDLRWSLLSAAVTLLAVFIHRRKLNQQRPAWHASMPARLMIFFLAWIWLQSLWALDSAIHLDASVRFAKYVIAFYLVYRLAETPERLRDILMVHVAGCAYLGVLALSATNYADGRLNGVGGPGIDDSNSLGMFLGTGAVVAAILALVERGWRRWFVIVAAPVILNGIVLAASRGAFLGLIAGGLLLVLVKPPKHRFMFWAAVLLGVVGTVSLMDQRFIDRMFSITDAFERTAEIDSSAESRWELIAAQFRMFSDHPMGTGHKGTAILSPRYLESKWLTTDSSGNPVTAARSSHNTFMSALVEQSIPGALVYLLFVAWGAGAVLSVRRRLRDGAPPQAAYGGAAAAALMVVLVAGQFTDYLMAEVQIWMLALLSAQLLQGWSPSVVAQVATPSRSTERLPVV